MMRTITHPSPGLDAYVRETEILTARRQPPSFFLGAGLGALFVLLEFRFFPERYLYLIFWVAAVVLIVSPVLFARRFLLRRRCLTWATAATVAATFLSLIGYAKIVGMEGAVTAGQLAVGFLVVAVAFPWTSGTQLLAVGPPLVGFGLFSLESTGGYLTVYVFTVVAGAALASVLVARYLDVQRWAIFRESRARNEAMVVTRSLLNVAREFSRTAEPDTVLDRIVRCTRNLLHVDWCVILLRQRPEGPFQIAAGSAQREDLLQEAAGLELDIEQYPMLRRLLEPGTVLEVSKQTPPNERERALMTYFRTRSMLAVPLDIGGAVMGILAIGNGATAEPFPPRASRILSGIGRQAAVAIQNAKLFADLQRANKLKSEFMAAMSHELRTPLNIVIGYADLLAEGVFGAFPPEASDAIKRIREQSRELLQLIDTTLDVNRLESGSLPVQVGEMRLTKFVEALRHQFAAIPRSESVSFVAEVRADGVLRTDLAKLTIVLRNLVCNAFKFTPRGHVRLEARLEPSGEATFVVEDTGIGIPEAERDKIFDMFYQVSRPGELSRGVGLGLYIVRKFVELLRGNVAVQSEEYRGTRFTVTIPPLTRSRWESMAPTGNVSEATQRAFDDSGDSGKAQVG